MQVFALLGYHDLLACSKAITFPANESVSKILPVLRSAFAKAAVEVRSAPVRA